MGDIGDDALVKLSRLAKLELSADEREKLKAELGEIINYFNNLKKLRTDNVEPTSQTTGLTNVLRADKIDSTRVLPGESALSGTDNTHNGAFVVEQLINKNQ